MAFKNQKNIEIGFPKYGIWRSENIVWLTKQMKYQKEKSHDFILGLSLTAIDLANPL